jgi:transposase
MGRRTFSREFKLSAVKLVQQQGYTFVQAAKNLGIDPASLRGWCKQFSLDEGDDAAGQPRGTGALQAELRQLREENKRLTMERDILKKATAFFAKESP